jgi:hypothetical protein
MARKRQQYWYKRGVDGCDETFDIYAPGDERPFTCVAFWEEEEWAEGHARRVVAALNACEGIPTEALELGVTTITTRWLPSGVALAWRRIRSRR